MPFTFSSTLRSKRGSAGCSQTGKSEKEATELAETVDRDRADFIKRYFDVEWPESHRFHLMVNSGMGDEMAVEIILDAICTLWKAAKLKGSRPLQQGDVMA